MAVFDFLGVCLQERDGLLFEMCHRVSFGLRFMRFRARCENPAGIKLPRGISPDIKAALTAGLIFTTNKMCWY